jgi:hypothetical protein
MNKWAVGVGIILLILSPVLLTSYKAVYATPKFSSGLASNVSNPSQWSSWERWGTFAKDDVIFVDLRPEIFWAQNPAAFDVENGYAVLYVDINITDPKSTMSQYELWLTYDATANQFSVYNASVLSFGDGINSTVYLPNQYNITYTFMAGRALLDGAYFANVTSVGFPYDYRVKNSTATPSYFALFYGRTTFQLSQPYSSLLYAGYVTIPASVIFLVYGLKTGKPINRASGRRLHQQLRRKNST